MRQIKAALYLLLLYIYLCGPDQMMDAVKSSLHSLGVADSKIIQEKF